MLPESQVHLEWIGQAAPGWLSAASTEAATAPLTAVPSEHWLAAAASPASFRHLIPFPAIY